MTMNTPTFASPLARGTVTLLLLGCAAGCGDGKASAPTANGSGASHAGGMAGEGPSGGANTGGSSAAGASAGGASGGASAGGASAGASSGGSETASGGSAQGGVGGSAGQATGGAAGSGGMPAEYVPISFGTTLDPTVQIAESQELALSLASPNSSTWRAKGDQHRTYHFAEANADVPYRLCVPADWDGTSELPLVMFLHGANNDESSYLDQNNKQMVTLAEQHGYVLVSPLGYNGAYGNFLRLSGDFSQPEGAAKLLAMRTPETERTQELSEKDVINVLELVLNEYPIDRSKMFLTGHSMGSGGTWYIGGKYSTYWAALAPMSGPFVLETGYPWENLRNKPVFVTEGLSAATVTGSRAVRDWMEAEGFPVTYKEVNADHAGMVPLVLPDVFTFFDQAN